MHLCQTSCGYRYRLELTEYVFDFALEVVFIDDLYFVIWKVRPFVLKHLEHLHVFLRGYSFKSADILTCLEINTAT